MPRPRPGPSILHCDRELHAAVLYDCAKKDPVFTSERGVTR